MNESRANLLFGLGKFPILSSQIREWLLKKSNSTQSLDSIDRVVHELRILVDERIEVITEIQTERLVKWFRHFADIHGSISNDELSTINAQAYINDLDALNIAIQSIRDELKIFLESINAIESSSKKLNILLNDQEKKLTDEFSRIQSRLNEQEKERKGLLEELSFLRAKTKTEAETISELKKELQAEINDVRERYKDNLADFELMAQEKIFREAADEGKTHRNYALTVIILLTIILIWTLFCFLDACWIDFNCICQAKDKCITSKGLETIFYYELIKKVTLRVLIISIIIFLLKFAVKNYNAIMHNRTINLHKANCFAAALRIHAGISNDVTKDNILSLAGKEIFQQHRTGYLSKDGNSNIDITLLEKIAGLFKSDK